MRNFYKGMDISSLPELRDLGVVFRDAQGMPKDAFTIIKENGINSIRLRIWNEPERIPEAKGYCNLAHTLEMAKEIRKNGLHFMLDFHYSDYWADPGQQRKPFAWKDLSFAELKQAVYRYTKEVLTTLADQNCLPDLVQVGNEIRSGMLFPDGAVPNFKQLTELLNEGIRACREVSEKTNQKLDVMIHLDQGGRFYYLKEWFDAVYAEGLLPIDCIGISYYPFWHGTFMDLKSSMEQLLERYGLPVYVVETAHPWRLCDTGHVSKELMDTAGLPAGIWEQKRVLQMVMQISDTASEKYGFDSGIYYWEPMIVPGYHHGSWDENMGMHDLDGKILPAYEAYRDYTMGSKVVDDLDAYMESLYAIDETQLVPAGVNLIPNGDFAKGMEGFWTIYRPNEAAVEVEVNEGEIYVSSQENFLFQLSREIHIDKAGKYCLSVDYRGTNTTNVKVTLFLKVITCNAEECYEKQIFPSDVAFVTHCLEDIQLPVGTVQVGICMDTPPVFGRIKNLRLAEQES